MTHPICKHRTKLSPQELKDLEEVVANSAYILNEVAYCLNKELTKVSSVIDEEAFANCDWALKQAFKGGVKKGLTIALNYVKMSD